MKKLMTECETSLLEAVEVWWTPDPEKDDHSTLRRASGFYRGDVEEGFAADIVERCVAAGVPQVESATEAMLTVGSAKSYDQGMTVALPARNGSKVTGVLVLRCRSGQTSKGGVEVWSRTERLELGLHRSFYANLPQFAKMSQCVKFPHASGLPGEVWADRFPRIVNDLGNSATFMRGIAADSSGLAVGVGWPFMRSEHDLDSVLLLLSSNESPIARIFEVWTTNDDESRMVLYSGFYHQVPAFRDASRRQDYCPGEDLVGKVWATNRPILSTDVGRSEIARKDAAEKSGLELAVGFPVFVGSTLRAIVTMYL